MVYEAIRIVAVVVIVVVAAAAAAAAAATTVSSNTIGLSGKFGLTSATTAVRSVMPATKILGVVLIYNIATATAATTTI